jgi:hypothetical protein
MLALAHCGSALTTTFIMATAVDTATATATATAIATAIATATSTATSTATLGAALSLEAYLQFARKRSSLSEGTKRLVYALFRVYARLKRARGMWDEGQ